MPEKNAIENRSISLQYNGRGDSQSKSNHLETPSISLPKGGGAIKSIDEKFEVNAISGTSSFSIPIPISPSRNGFRPSLSLSYNSGSGNGPFGLGWDVAIPFISRKTEKKLPEYKDSEDSDTFILSGADDLVPLLEKNGSAWSKYVRLVNENGIAYSVKRYRPRIEGSFAVIEKWENKNTHEVFWKTISSNNIHSYYGLTSASRLSDPADPLKIFSWFLCKIHDDKGSITLFIYKKEDFADVPKKLNEKNRIGKSAQIYLKRVVYGNKTPYYIEDDDPVENNFLFKVVFDYGEHDISPDIPIDIDDDTKNIWPCRTDPFSSYRAGFEIRTYRKCSRVLMFHCFDQPDLPHNPYLVASLQLFYNDGLDLSNHNTIEGFSFMVKAQQNGHKLDAIENVYTTKSLPFIEVNYQQHEWNTAIKKADTANTIHTPVVIDDKQYLWIDLFNEGISGILSEQAGAWFYKSNLGDGNFSMARPVANRPSLNGLNKNLSISDLEGNGIKYLVQYDRQPKGFFKFTEEEVWEPFKSFSEIPAINLSDRNTRFIDLTGDGIADLLRTEENQFHWYEGLGEKGFSVSKNVANEIDEEKGPAIVFDDGSQTIFLADINGDGLTNIVRIRNGEICYWPNLGYGRFGTKVNMDNAPLFDHPDAFNPVNLRLADIDGSGTIDVIYLGKNDFRVWMNLNGNEFTKEPQIIPAFPAIDNLADIAVLDFLGSGTACIVYSSSAPQQAQQPLQYIDLMGSKKPALLIGYQNNCGKEVTLEYKPSTFYYLEDKMKGIDWVTKLPFPVHCISKVTSKDKISQTVFTTGYAYRHGYYDYAEKEFRGFARVEYSDTEVFEEFKINDAKNVVEEDLYQPPVRTISWFHTGAFIRNKKLLHQCEKEYFKNDLFSEYNLPEPVIEDQLTADELREAMRACKGLPLRTEIYADDNTDKSSFPYSAKQSNLQIRLIQPKADNNYASFLSIPSESIVYGYERDPADPHIAHSFVIEADELSHITKSASVIYPRIKRPVTPFDVPDKVWEEQGKIHIVYEESFYTNDIISPDIYRLRASCESKLYEVNGINQPPDFFYNKEALVNSIAATTQILFEDEFDGSLQKRLSKHSRIYFQKDNTGEPLPAGQLSLLGLIFKSYNLAFTKDLVIKYYGSKVSDQMLADAKYVHLEGDADWWIQSGTCIYNDDPAADFYLPVGETDVFGNETRVAYDQYNLLVNSTVDSIGNTVYAKNDYRTLSPFMITDANLNRTAVESDELGMVIKSALLGKDGSGEGDTLDDPTTRIEYDFSNWQNNQKPNYVHTFIREVHGAANPRFQESFIYSDGRGSIIMSKTQAAPGKAKQWNDTTQQVDEVDANPRWIGNGRAILNNKGNPVKRYEPYFSVTPGYESEEALVETGITPVIYYDPLGRNIKTVYPNGTFIKSEFGGWYSKSFDVNDTVKDSQWYVDRNSPDPGGAEPQDPEQRAAWLAAKCYNTPGIAHTDFSKKAFYMTTDHGNGKTTDIYSETDPFERYSKTHDQLNRNIAEAYANLSGASMYGKTAEHGERWILTDVLGRLVRIWDNNVREFYCTFDQLHRLVSTFVKDENGEVLFEHAVYGDLYPDAEAIARNIKGRVYQLFDQAGVLTMNNIDFKGNATQVERRLTKEYKTAINWNLLEGMTDINAIQTTIAPVLEDEIFTSSVVLDALNRPVNVTLPDQSIVQPTYNEANYPASIKVKIRGGGDFITFLESQDYDEKGQRQFATYGNNNLIKYFYDPTTFRLSNLVTQINAGGDNNQIIQDLHYTFDPVGNITQVRDNAQQTIFFKNAVVYPESKFEYDVVYQLKKAAGRELAGLGGDVQRGPSDAPFMQQLPLENDTNAVRNYTEQYEYDDCGNIKRLQHSAVNANWAQSYQYLYEKDVNNTTNRLNATSLAGDADGVFSAIYRHDLHGNMTSMPHLSDPASLQWDFKDQLKQVNLGGGGMAYYVYGSGGNRVRKIIERNGGKKTERIYLDAVEIYRERQSDAAPLLERYTLHVSDNTGLIAQVDVKTIDVNNSDPSNNLNEPVIRYQFTNRLGSALLETDEGGNVISYEEYHPYGTSAYRIFKPGSNISLKRYRFSGKERDDETGFYYFGARYYASWLGRWVSADPGGFVDGFNLYKYCRNNPVTNFDPIGLAPPDKLVFPIPDERKPDLKDLSPEAGKRLERQIEITTFNIDDHQYQFEGHIDVQGDHWFYTWTAWHEKDASGNTIDSGTNPNAAPGTGLYDLEFEKQLASGAFGGQTFGGGVQGADPAAVPIYRTTGGGGTLTRLFGALQIIGGVFEELAAGALAVVPEPTLLTKAGAVVVGAHGADDIYTGFKTLFTGDFHRTVTFQATFAVAKDLGASDNTATWIGTGADIGAGAGPSFAGGVSRRMAMTTIEATLEEEGSSVSLAYLHRGATQMGHTAVGITTSGTTSWFDLAGDINVTGGVSFAERSVPNAGYWVSTVGVDSASAERALATANQMTNELSPSTWTLMGNNCSTTAGDVLTQAGIASSPLWSRTPWLLHIGINNGYFISAGMSTSVSVGSYFMDNSPPPAPPPPTVDGIAGSSGN